MPNHQLGSFAFFSESMHGYKSSLVQADQHTGRAISAKIRSHFPKSLPHRAT